MSTHGLVTSEGLQRLQKILDETCEDFGIARNFAYAVTSREFLGKELFRIHAADRLQTRRQLSNFGCKYGLRQSRKTPGKQASL